MALSMMVYYPKGMRPDALLEGELSECFSTLRDFDGTTYKAATDQVAIEPLTNIPWECVLVRIRSEELVSDKVFVLFRYGKLIGAIPEHFTQEARVIRNELGVDLLDIYGCVQGVVFEYAGGCEVVGNILATARRQLVKPVK